MKSSMLATERIVLTEISKKIFIFDIDGTVANCEHRQHFLRRPRKERDWKSFRDLTRLDTPHDDILFLLKLFAAEGHTILFVTARTESERDDTEWWFENVAGLTSDMWQRLYMRADRDNREDTIIKKEILDVIRRVYGEPYMVFEDRARVVAMWRENGVRCLHVEPGEF
jgi:hypothetical protein